jgi:hypothetical protein
MVFRAYVKAAHAAVADVPGGPRGYQVLAAAAHGAVGSQLALAQHLGVDRTVMTYLLDGEDADHVGTPADRTGDARLYTGLRQGEALGLRWSDVDVDAQRLTVRMSPQRVFPREGMSRLELVEPKTRKSRWPVPFPRRRIPTRVCCRHSSGRRPIPRGTARSAGGRSPLTVAGWS